MKRCIIYIHGKGGNAGEAEHYQPLFADSDVVGFDYQSQNPWEAKQEFPHFVNSLRERYNSIVLVANSIGAFFAMSALSEKTVEKALFISPIVDMERLIQNMITWANVTEEQLRTQKEIPTEFGETLSWDYLCYVRAHPITWNVPTCILYGEKDAMTSQETMTAFAERVHAPLTVMQDGEHWFHTEEQMAFLDSWVKESMQ